MLVTLGRGLAPASVIPGIPSFRPLIPSCIFDLDASRIVSYGGTAQTWDSLSESPADGTVKSRWTAYLGANSTPSTDDPSYTRPAGSSGAYWTNDGADRFSISAPSNFGDDPFFRRLSTTQPWSVACAMRTAGSIQTGTVSSVILQAGANTTTTTGLSLRIQSDGFFLRSSDRTNSTSHLLTATIPPLNSDVFIGFSYNPNTGAFGVYINGNAPVTGTQALSNKGVLATNQ